MELRSGTVVPPSPHARAIAQVQGHTRRPLLSAEGLGMFHHGVGLILSRWTALQLAIHNGWGGSSSHIKAQQFHDDIVSWMAQSKVSRYKCEAFSKYLMEPLQPQVAEPTVRYIDELEDMLDENLVALFNTETEDGSLEEVAEKIMSLYEDCLDGNFQTINDLISNNNAASLSASKSQEVDNEEENENPSVMPSAEECGETNTDAMETEDSEHNAVLQAPVSDENLLLEDGWQLVSSKTKRKPRRT